MGMLLTRDYNSLSHKAREIERRRLQRWFGLYDDQLQDLRIDLLCISQTKDYFRELRNYAKKFQNMLRKTKLKYDGLREQLNALRKATIDAETFESHIHRVQKAIKALNAARQLPAA